MTSEIQPASRVYNWHPAVHTRFGETLYFYLLRVKRHYRGSVASQVQSILDRADIGAACEYTLYGHWDALIRVWLTSSSRRRLLKELDAPDSNIERVRDYATHQIRHLWSENDGDLLAEFDELRPSITERDADIKDAVENFDHVLDPGVVERLEGNRLLVERPTSDAPDPVKFYVCLKLNPDVGEKAGRNGVLDALEKAGLAHSSSLYTGVGVFADYLVRCVADTYSDILRLTAAFDESLQDLDIRPMTLLIADRNTRESDNLNDITTLSAEDENSLDLLELSKHEVRQIVTSWTASQRSSLHELVRIAYGHSEGDTELRQKLRDLLRASCRDDHQAVTAATSFMIDFEWFLIEYLKRAWGLAYGGAWMDHLSKTFATSFPEKGYAQQVQDPENWTLGLCVQMAIASAEMDNQLAANLAQQLGPKWKPDLRILHALRNKIAHGKLRKERLNDFSGEWGKLLAELMAVAALHYRIERMINDGGSEDDD